jgi:aminoglycoside phosphotransferase (APT) family kinase protein
MDDITLKVLASTKAFLERLTQSDKLSSDQLTEAHMAVTAIGYQLNRHAYTPALLDEIRDKERALSKEIGTLLGKSTRSQVTRKWQVRWNDGVGAELTSVLEYAKPVVGEKKLEARVEATVAERLKNFLIAFHEPADPAISAGTRNAYEGGRGDVRDDGAGGAIYITAAALQEFLRGRFQEHRDTTVLSVERLMGGYSKETYIVNVHSDRGEEIFVIRKDGYGLPTGSSVVFEFGVLQEVHGLGVPTPKPLWLEQDTSRFGTAFMAVSFAKGEPAYLSVPDDPAVRQQWTCSLATALAKLHRSTRRDDGVDVREMLRADIAELQARVEERERNPHPGIAFGLSWLVSHLDDLAGRPACRVHGDVGFHNMLMRDHKILALLDWEFSHLSDPVEDLIYIKPFIDKLESWPRFLELYEAESGFRYDSRAARYFNVWKDARNMVACMGSLNSLLLPRVKDVALSVAGTIYIPKFEISLLDSILEGARSNV